MKKQISRGIPVGIIVLSTIYYSFYYWPPPTLTVSINQYGATNNTATFSLTDLPAISGTGSHFRVMLSHGDGTYFLGKLSELATHTHTYNYNSSAYLAFAEVVAAYDDKKKPPKRTATIPISTVNNFTTVPSNNMQIMNGKKILLRKSTTAVPGDTSTYMITYEHNPECGTGSLSGLVRFRFDDSKFDFVKTDAYRLESPTTTTGRVDFGFSSLNPGEQRSVFVLLKTKSSATPGDMLSPPMNAELVLIRGPEDTCAIYRDTILGQAIAYSHDPNFKTVTRNDLCMGDSVTWRIDFQNEGDAAESKVVISDWIDTLLEYESVTIVGSKFDVDDTIRYFPANREWRFVMNGITLRGLGERGVPEEQTKGYVLVRAKKRVQARCNAAANSARILFGCNPPVFTDVSLAEFPCDSFCTCSTLKDLTLPNLAADSGGVLLSAAQIANIFNNTLPAGPWSYKWYPVLGLNDPFALAPELTGAFNRTYTLVAAHSVSCSRVVVRVPVLPTTTLSTTVHTTCSSNLWDMTATAKGQSTADILWNTCDSGVGSISKNGLAGGLKVYVGVWDTMTDQVSEKWVLLPHACPPGWPTWIYVVLGLLIIVATGWYWILRR